MLNAILIKTICFCIFNMTVNTIFNYKCVYNFFAGMYSSYTKSVKQ